MSVIALIFYVVALVCFLLAAFNTPSRVGLVALGLAAWVATQIPGLLR